MHLHPATDPVTPPDQVVTKPPTLSAFASLPPLFRRDLLTLFARASQSPLVRLDYLGFRLFQLNDPALIRQVLLDKERRYRKGRLMRRLGAVTGEGLLINDGERWKKHRRLANPSMSGRRLAGYAPAMAESARLLVERWRALPAGEPVDLIAEISRTTLIALLRTLFGIDYDARYADVSEVIHRLLDALVQRGSSLLAPPLSWPTPSNLAFRRKIAEAEAILARIIDSRRRHLDDDDDPSDLLGQWLRQREQDPEHFTPDEMRDELMTMLIAGHHSLAIALSWALWEIAGDADLQQGLRTEVDALEQAPTDADAVQTLPLTQGAFLEALRLYPQPPILLRDALGDHVLGGYRIRAGDQLIINILAIHHDPQLWPEPHRFRADRYPNINPDHLMQAHHLGFGGGPRSCIGRRFALIEGTLLLAHLLRGLQLDRATTGPIEPRFAGMMVPTAPLLLHVTPR
ncbi:cytochrome P450 [Lamprobacter modestohalophilus]|uniref:cytochrome P450 n=1 Tax=Lamprobacter modestohalophilus TaxID=1064514 RepID=UPI002ADEDB9F|nr:cytochrome P450 [Lamprobacter modestohalophilus]MEA1049909.1 cytochrome P450 [Lamprobacter modestohalophilus]